MPDIEHYSRIGCPKIHLRLYGTVMRAHGIDDAQLVALFPMSLSGATRVEATKQRPDESISSFVTRWRAKVAGMIDRPKEQDQIDMVLRNLQPRSGEVGAISYQYRRPAHHSPYRPPPVRVHFPHPQYQYQPDYVQEPYIAQTSMQPRPPHPRAATHSPPRPYAQRPARQFTPLGMTLTRALRSLEMVIQGHDTERCSAFHHAIQDLIDSGLVNLAGPSVTTNPLFAHSTHAVPPPPSLQ
ncbi:hypothetical protein CK203_016642 [Vitis vinifera]|uniref:Uncharacterized protein n=1 Tax=Vitis vinifera TaxID=29760 RepID=A0A438J2S0_VITVI|nr:hypothetical protein CK203_016642 [Vitis vinifera]